MERKKEKPGNKVAGDKCASGTVLHIYLRSHIPWYYVRIKMNANFLGNSAALPKQYCMQNIAFFARAKPSSSGVHPIPWREAWSMLQVPIIGPSVCSTLHATGCDEIRGYPIRPQDGAGTGIRTPVDQHCTARNPFH